MAVEGHMSFTVYIIFSKLPSMHKALHFLRGKQKILLQVALSLLFVGLGVYFFRHEEAEIPKVIETLKVAKVPWMLAGGVLLLGFIAVQGLMYVYSFKAIDRKIGLVTAMALFLKRNLISVFLPAGLLTNMFFFTAELERKEGVSKTDTYFASSIFSINSILSSVIIGVPALIWLLVNSKLSGGMISGVLLIVLFMGTVIYAIRDIRRGGPWYHYLDRKMPSLSEILNNLRQNAFDHRAFWMVLLLSCVIEFIGISHLYISMEALDLPASWSAAIIGYAIVLVLLMSSPFLRGVGVIEVALTYALTLFGLTTIEAISVAMLFRFFEFWALLILGILLLLFQRGSLLVRVFPAILLFALGLVNIFSAITPAVPSRMHILADYLPLAAINASTYFVLFSGVLMLGVGAYLLRGLRNAWWMAVVLSALSLLTHLTKGIDYEEATLALVVLISLLVERRHYFIRNDLALARLSLFPGLVALFGVLAFGTIGFYFINIRHFNADFTLLDSLKESATSLLLLNVDLVPVTRFAKEFLYGMHFLGGASLAYLAFLSLRPLVIRSTSHSEDQERARELIRRYGKSPLDYFKSYEDKSFWFSANQEGMVAYKTSRTYAIVLENPVCKDETAMAQVILDFEKWCRDNGLRTAWYRIPQHSLSSYEQLGKKFLPVGEDATIDLIQFNLQGASKKALRNVLNRLEKEGYTFHSYEPPQSDRLLQQLQAVSGDWLKETGRNELVFSQGLFSVDEIRQQTVFTIENNQGKVVGFVNIIPCTSPGMANFDLMRRTHDAPNGVMDYLFVRMFEALREKGFTECNLGMVPMSGIDDPENFQERIIKLAYERIRQFSHYKSLRFFKEKFDPHWEMMYLVYNEPFDLIYLPGALEKVMES